MPSTYCTPGTATHGCSADISASASPSLSFAEPCQLVVLNVEGKRSVMVFYGIDNSGFSPVPWGASSSFLCVRAPRQHTPIQPSGGINGGCSGTASLDWNVFQQSHPVSLGNPWSAGDQVFVQAWFRDPPSPQSTNLSDAVELTYVP